MTTMRLFNMSEDSAAFNEFVMNVAKTIKEMRHQGMDQTSMGEILIWLGKDEEDLDDDVWEQNFELDDSLLKLEIDRIAAEMTDRLH